MGRNNQVRLARLDGDVAHSHVRQASLELRPMRAAVDRNEQPEFGAHKQQIRINQILAHYVRVAGKLLCGKRCPGLAVVFGPVDVGLHVASGVAIKSRVRNGGIEMTGLDRGDPCVWRQTGNVLDDIGPTLSVVACDLHVAIVGSNPNYVAILGRLGNRINRLVLLGIRIVDGQTARKLLMLARRIVGGEIGRNAFPGLAVIARPKQELPAQINSSRMVGARMDRRIPVKAKVRFSSPWQRLDVPRLPGALAEARNSSALVFHIGIVGIGRIGECPKAVSHADHAPRAVRDSIDTARWSHPCAIILQAAVDVVRIGHVIAHVIELRDRQIRKKAPVVCLIL